MAKSNPLTTDSGRKTRTKVGDSVDLGGGRMGQVWGQAPGTDNWHVVDDNQKAHIYSGRNKTATPSRSAEFELANYRGQVNQKYADPLGSWHFPRPAANVGRKLYLNNTEASALSRVRPKKGL